MRSYLELIAYPDAELAKVDPLVMNLLVAKSIPSLAHLEIAGYVARADACADEIRRRLPEAEKSFWQTPQDWKNDINFFRLGFVHSFCEQACGISYKPEHRNAKAVWYTDPSDLFVNGVMDTRRGTCGNMPVFQVALGWRLGYPVFLACVRSHFILRYDDGKVTHNIEATQAGHGGFKSDPDDYLIREYNLPPVAVRCGSELRALRPREMLGAFVGLRGRHMRDTERHEEAERDYLLARFLFPNNRYMFVDEMALAVARGARMFEPQELGSPESMAEAIIEQYGLPKRPAPMSGLAIRDVIYTTGN